MRGLETHVVASARSVAVVVALVEIAEAARVAEGWEAARAESPSHGQRESSRVGAARKARVAYFPLDGWGRGGGGASRGQSDKRQTYVQADRLRRREIIKCLSWLQSIWILLLLYFILLFFALHSVMTK